MDGIWLSMALALISCVPKTRYVIFNNYNAYEKYNKYGSEE